MSSLEPSIGQTESNVHCFQSSLDALDQGITIFDADLKLVFANRKFLELRDLPAHLGKTGIDFEDQVRFRAERGDYGPGNIDSLVEANVQLARKFEAHRIERIRSDGTVLKIRGDPLPGGGFVATYTDTTERNRLEEALVAQNSELDHAKHAFEQQGHQVVTALENLSIAQQELHTANSAKAEFLANMSHELRTPLNAIIGFSDMIQKEIFGPVGSPRYLDYVNDISRSGHHLLDLINDILDLSKIESGCAKLDEESIDIPDVTRSIIAMVRLRAEELDVRLEEDLPADLPALYADRRKLKQILINLLSNAIKFTPPGGRVALRAWTQPDNGYVFQVVDSGIGIAFEDIPKALAPFQQVDSYLKHKFEGTGLGLPLSKSLVELHGGYLDLQSKVDSGTTVTVRFPAERLVSEPAD